MRSIVLLGWLVGSGEQSTAHAVLTHGTARNASLVKAVRFLLLLVLLEVLSIVEIALLLLVLKFIKVASAYSAIVTTGCRELERVVALGKAMRRRPEVAALPAVHSIRNQQVVA